MTVNNGRFTAEIEGDFVVFIIGAKPSKLRFVQSMLDIGERKGGMQAMLDNQMADPDSGLLGYELVSLFVCVQYWRSYDHLEAFAKDPQNIHLPTWRKYFKRVGKSGRTGIWHETFLVKAGQYEAIYTNMPTYGLAKASEVVAVADSSSSRSRLTSA